MPIPPCLIARLPAQLLSRRIVIEDDEQVMIAIRPRFAAVDRAKENDALGIELGHHPLQERRRNQQGRRAIRFCTRSHHLMVPMLGPDRSIDFEPSITWFGLNRRVACQSLDIAGSGWDPHREQGGSSNRLAFFCRRRCR